VCLTSNRLTILDAELKRTPAAALANEITRIKAANGGMDLGQDP
jgi:uncharacterized small protein (DUF1192 family)